VRVAFGVVIVDDNPLFLETARNLLEREGLHVVGLAATAAQALQRTAELRPDIVLVDISLGDESGFDVARSLVEHDRSGGTAVILISTHS
jgi:DNA-binding NarL/FixJ family response regulator